MEWWQIIQPIWITSRLPNFRNPKIRIARNPGKVKEFIIRKNWKSQALFGENCL